MIRLLIFILFFSMAPQSFATRMSLRCANLFSIEEDVQNAVEGLIESAKVKRQLLEQTKHNKNIRKFVLEFSTLLETLHDERFADIAYGIPVYNLKNLGFSTPYVAKVSKQAVLHKQIKILSIMNSEDLTPEFEKDFIRIVHQIYSPLITKEEVLKISNRLEHILWRYENPYPLF